MDEKERMAGHNPEEEMGLYGFSDYKRPATGGYVPMYMSDQDPIKGSRTSMDMSDKPMESEGGSMDEYGDIDPGRFNEDGSFIGIYGKSSTNMDVWDWSLLLAQSANLPLVNNLHFVLVYRSNHYENLKEPDPWMLVDLFLQFGRC